MPLASREEMEARYGQMVAEQRAREAAAAQQISQGVGGATRGLGLGLMDQVRYFRDLAQKGGQIAGNYINDIAMMRDPTRNLPGYTELSAMGEAALNPQTYIDYGRDVYKQVTESPESLGRLIGQNINPFRLPGGVAPREIFIGKKAKTWNPIAAERAVAMENAGHDPQTIWRETGTFRGPEGEWRQEINDLDAYLRQPPDIQAAIDQRKAQIANINQRVKELKEGVKTQPDLFPKEFNQSVRELAASKKPLQEDIKGNFGLEYGATGYLGSRARLAMQHPELFEAYPEIGQHLIIRRNQDLGDTTKGLYSSLKNRIDIGNILSKKPQSASSTALHELQHAVQEQEGFAKGGSPAQFQTKFDAELQALKDDLSKALVGNSSSSIHEILNNFDLIDQEKLQQIAQKHGIDTPNEILQTLKLGQNRATPVEQYRRLAGEAEARAVQKRWAYDPDFRRRVFPLESYDVPISDLIIQR